MRHFLSVFFLLSIQDGFSTALETGKTSLDKRADDVSVNALNLLLQQQAEVIQKQSADIQALQAEVAAMKTAGASRDSQLQKLQQKVAFTAHFSHGGALDIGQSAPIPFSQVTINEGQGYDSSTGIFTAPVSGIYLFLLHLKSDNSKDGTSAMLAIMQSGNTIATISVSGRTSEFHKSSISVATHANAGEKVFVRHQSGSTLIDNWQETSFTGVLLSAD